MRSDRVYVCVKGPQPNATIDMALAVNQEIQDFINICMDILQEDVYEVRVIHPFGKPGDSVLLNPNDTFFDAGVANGDVLILN